MPIQDQRTMSGPDVHRTSEDVAAVWRAPRGGWSERARRGDYSTELYVSDVELAAYVSAGRWVADCPSCGSGVAGWPDHSAACCLGCGTIYRHVVYPSAEAIAEAERLLEPRPVDARNWRPHEGETVADLEAENVAHGAAI